MKRFAAILLSLGFIFSVLAIPAAAQTWQGEEFTLSAPEDMYQLGPWLDVNDPLWALAGVAEVESRLKDYDEMGVLVNFVSKEGGTGVSVMRKDSQYAKDIHNLDLLDEAGLQQVLDDLPVSKDENLTVEKGWYNNGQRQDGGLLFYWVKLDMAGENEMHELIYGTIVNGYALNIDLYGGKNPITPEQEEMMEGIMRSVKFNTITEKPLVSEEDQKQSLNALLTLLLLLFAIAVPLIYVPIKGRIDKKQKKRLADQLSEYHKTHDKDEAQGEPVFINATDCTKEAIHSFSMYQSFYKNTGELIFGLLMCIIMLSTAFLLDTEWWMKIIAVAVTVYYGYKIAAMPSTIEKIQRRVYSRGPSSTAQYTFYPEVFRVSGIQSASLTPYFQISEVRRKGQYIYLYYGPENAYMVDQYGFSKGEFEEFYKFIREKTGKN